MGCTNSNGQVLIPPQPRPVYGQQQPQRFRVTIPLGVNPGQKFVAIVNGEQFHVVCPPNAFGGQDILINVPAQRQQVQTVQFASYANEQQQQPMYGVQQQQPMYAQPVYTAQQQRPPGNSGGAGQGVLMAETFDEPPARVVRPY